MGIPKIRVSLFCICIIYYNLCDCFAFIRLICFRYTEAENPNHMVVVMSSSIPIHSICTAALIPTVEEYICLIHETVTQFTKRKPSYIGVDAQECVLLLRMIMEPLGIKISYYPPPSQEERSFVDASYIERPRCAYCQVPHCLDGSKLLTCSRCKSARYCCKEHQKAHWKQHKKYCL